MTRCYAILPKDYRFRRLAVCVGRHVLGADGELGEHRAVSGFPDFEGSPLDDGHEDGSFEAGEHCSWKRGEGGWYGVIKEGEDAGGRMDGLLYVRD